MEPSPPSPERPEAPAPDMQERGLPRKGQPQFLERRLFMQLLVLDAEAGIDEPTAASQLHAVLLHTPVAEPQHDARSRALATRVDGVVYADIHAPRGFGLLVWSEDPALFPDLLRPRLDHYAPGLRARAGWSMLGRTYSTGYEDDLDFWLLRRPRETALNPAWSWALWYPLRRTGAWNRLDGRERGGILREHGEIGKSYGRADLAHDIRLACHGLDPADNEFVIGLVGGDLHPLSRVVQDMRGTRQTAEYMEKMGPFFVGRKLFQNPA